MNKFQTNFIAFLTEFSQKNGEDHENMKNVR